MKKATRSEKQGSQSQADSTTKPKTKIARVLEHLLGKSLMRFEAERIGDHCLHSTISSLAHNYGLRFKRTPEKAPNNWGAPCDVIRYSLPSSEHTRAQHVLAMLTRKSGKE